MLAVSSSGMIVRAGVSEEKIATARNGLQRLNLALAKGHAGAAGRGLYA